MELPGLKSLHGQTYCKEARRVRKYKLEVFCFKVGFSDSESQAATGDHLSICLLYAFPLALKLRGSSSVTEQSLAI